MKKPAPSAIEESGEVTRRKALSWLSGFGLFGSLIISAASNFIFSGRFCRAILRASARKSAPHLCQRGEH